MNKLKQELDGTNNQPRVFHVGDSVAHVRPDGSIIDEGIVTSVGGRFISVMFDDDSHEKQMQAFQLKKL